MPVIDIQTQINQNETLITQYRAEIKKLSDQIFELETLRTKVSNLQDRLEQEQGARKRKLKDVSSFTRLFVTAKSYVSGMNDLLTGAEYQKAAGGLADGIQRINDKIKELQKQIELLKTDIRNLQIQNNDLYDQLRYQDAEHT